MNVNDYIWVRFVDHPDNWRKMLMWEFLGGWGHNFVMGQDPPIVNNEILFIEPEECKDPLVRFREYLIEVSDRGDEARMHSFNEVIEKFDSLVLGRK